MADRLPGAKSALSEVFRQKFMELYNSGIASNTRTYSYYSRYAAADHRHFTASNNTNVTGNGSITGNGSMGLWQWTVE